MAELRVPDEIVDQSIRIERDWGDSVPAYAEFIRPGKSSLWKHWSDLNVGDCEQLVAWHVQQARKAIERFLIRPRASTATTAAKHICRSRLYRGLYRVLLNLPPDENDQPFRVRENA